MREAIITCTCPSIRIPDLGLTLSKGNAVHMDADKAQSSKDLAIAKKAFGVTVEYIGRCRTQRPGSGNVPAPPPVPPPPPPKLEPPEKSPGIDLDKLAALVAEKMGRDVGSIRELLKGDLRELLVETLTGLSLTGTSSRNSGRVAPGQQEEVLPMFIPDGLVGDTKADIEVQQGANESDSVDEATAALRRMRKKRKS